MLPRLLAILALVALATSAYAAQLTLTWQDNSTNETAFNIERAPASGTPLVPSGAFTALSFVGTNVTTYVDASVTETLAYCYRVNASNSNPLPSPYSNVACRVVAATVPGAPSNLLLSFVGTGGGKVKTSPVVETCSTEPGLLHIACEIPLPLGMLVTIQETPDTKSKFVGWGEACRGMSGQCTVAMAGDVLVSVAFAPR